MTDETKRSTTAGPPDRAVTSAVLRRWTAVADEQLVGAVRRGDEEAFAELHRRYHGLLSRYAARVLGHRHRALEDVLQDVFQRAHTALTSSDARPLVLRPWLFRLTYNRCIDEIRAGRHVHPLPEHFEHPTPSGDPLWKEVSARMTLRETVDDIAGLPARQRAALVAVAFEGRSHEQLAAELNTSVQASKNLVSRARGGLLELRAARAGEPRRVREAPATAALELAA